MAITYGPPCEMNLGWSSMFSGISGLAIGFCTVRTAPVRQDTLLENTPKRNRDDLTRASGNCRRYPTGMATSTGAWPPPPSLADHRKQPLSIVTRTSRHTLCLWSAEAARG
jgi:hypothetical protein